MCPYGDPFCPCQDGDACHYVAVGDSPAMDPPMRWVIANAIDSLPWSPFVGAHYGYDQEQIDSARSHLFAAADRVIDAMKGDKQS